MSLTDLAAYQAGDPTRVGDAGLLGQFGRVDPVAGDDVLDLGATVVPVLLRPYRIPLLAGAAGVALVVWW